MGQIQHYFILDGIILTPGPREVEFPPISPAEAVSARLPRTPLACLCWCDLEMIKDKDK